MWEKNHTSLGPLPPLDGEFHRKNATSTSIEISQDIWNLLAFDEASLQQALWQWVLDDNPSRPSSTWGTNVAIFPDLSVDPVFQKLSWSGWEDPKQTTQKTHHLHKNKTLWLPKYWKEIKALEQKVWNSKEVDEELANTTRLLIFLIKELGIYFDRDQSKPIDIRNHWRMRRDFYIEMVSSPTFDLWEFTSISQDHGTITLKEYELIAQNYHREMLCESIRNLCSDTGIILSEHEIDEMLGTTRFIEISERESSALKSLFHIYYNRLTKQKIKKQNDRVLRGIQDAQEIFWQGNTTDESL